LFGLCTDTAITADNGGSDLEKQRQRGFLLSGIWRTRLILEKLK
jgi:hypothetical protein